MWWIQDENTNSENTSNGLNKEDLIELDKTSPVDFEEPPKNSIFYHLANTRPEPSKTEYD